jgi:hypothetical protein
VFTDRVIATLVVLRFQLPHAALAVFYGVDRSTITRAVQEIRPLLAARGLAVPGHPGLRLHTLADVFAYAAAEGVTLRADGSEARSAGPGRTGPDGGRSSRASAGRTPRRPPSSPAATAPPCGPGRSGPAASMTQTALSPGRRRPPQARRRRPDPCHHPLPAGSFTQALLGKLFAVDRKTITVAVEETLCSCTSTSTSTSTTSHRMLVAQSRGVCVSSPRSSHH